MFQRNSSDDHLLIVQCNSGHQHTDLIACARYRILDEQTQSSHLKINTHIIFIIGLPRKSGGTKFFSFQGGKWESYHMDTLVPLKDSLITIKGALNMSINDILSECKPDLHYKRLQNWISLLHFNNAQIEQNVLDRFNLLSLLIKDSHVDGNIDKIPNDSLKQTCKFNH